MSEYAGMPQIEETLDDGRLSPRDCFSSNHAAWRVNVTFTTVQTLKGSTLLSIPISHVLYLLSQCRMPEVLTPRQLPPFTMLILHPPAIELFHGFNKK